jgi:hypothetical protein
VDVEQRRQLGGCFRRQVALHRVEFARDGIAGAAQPLDLGVDVFGSDVVVRDVEPTRSDQHGPADRDAARHRQAEELETHGSILAAADDGRASESTMRACPAHRGGLRSKAATRLRRTCRR